MITVRSAKYLSGYQIRFGFSDGVELTVDLKENLTGEMFTPLKDLNEFRQFSIDAELETIVWKNGADFAPEFLYELGKKQLKKPA